MAINGNISSYTSIQNPLSAIYTLQLSNHYDETYGLHSLKFRKFVFGSNESAFWNYL